MADITLRGSLGRALTHDELDGNFESLNDNKSEIGHTHPISDITSLQSSLDGKISTSAMGATGEDVLAANSAADARTALGLGSLSTASTINDSNWSGTDLAVANGGTGASTAADARTNLGLGSISTQASSSVSITGGSISGITDLAVADGGTGASDAATARTNLGLAIGTDVQAYDSELAAIAGLTSAADKAPYFTGSGTAALADLTSFGRSLIDDANASAARTTLGLGSLATASTINNVDWSGTDLAVANGGTGASTAADARTNLGLGTAATSNTGDFAAASHTHTVADLPATIDLTSKTYVRVPTPSASTDAATKAYVDSVATGFQPKDAVACATTANITLSGEQTIDGVLTSASRVLVKNQTTVANNGIYVSAAGAWSRATDMNDWAEVPGALVFVSSGTTNGSTSWASNSATSGTIGVTDMTWVQTSAPGSYTAGTGLSLSGSQFAINDTELLALAGLTSAADKVPYFTGSGTAAVADFSSFGRTLVDDASASAARTTLGLGDLSTQTASSVSITGGSITGITDLAVADGGTGSSTAAGARTNLGLVIGTNVQAYDAELAAIAGLTSAADKVPYFTGSGTAATADFTSFGRSLVDDANASAARTTLGLGTAATQNTGTSGANIPLLNASNTWSANQNFGDGTSGTIVNINGASGNSRGVSIYSNSSERWRLSANSTAESGSNAGSNFVISSYTDAGAFLEQPLVVTRSSGLVTVKQLALTTDLAVADGGTGASDAATARTNLGLAIGTNVQAYDATLNAMAGVATAADKIIYFTGTDTASSADLTSFARTLLDDTTASAARTTLGLGTMATQGDSAVAITGGSITGITDLAVADGGTGASTASGARTNLGLGTAATYNTGTSGATVPLLNAANTFVTNQSIGTGSGTSQLFVDGGAGSAKNVHFRTGTSKRWVVGSDSVAESGANAGSNFALYSYDDSDIYIESPLSINRSTGTTTLKSLALSTDLAVTHGGTGASTAADARTNLGLGTISTQASSSVSITGGSITGITDLAVADGGTGSSTAAGARTNLGLVIGTDVQAYDSTLQGLSSLATTTGVVEQTSANVFGIRSVGSYTSSSLPTVGVLGIYTPQMFGAVADGVTDDLSAFQLCLDTIISAGKGLMYIPAGTYYLSDRMEDISTNNTFDIKIVGAGIGATKIKLGSSAKGFLALVNTGQNNINAHVEGLEIRLQGEADKTQFAIAEVDRPNYDYRVGTLTNAISTTSGSSTYSITHSLKHGLSVGQAVRLHVARTLSITGASKANPCVITSSSHGLYTGDVVEISGISGMTQLNGESYTVTRIDANTFSLDGINSTSYSTYTSGGTITTAAVGGTTINGEYRVASLTSDYIYTISAFFDGTAMPTADATVASSGGTITYSYPNKGRLAAGAVTAAGGSGLMVVDNVTAHGLSIGDHVWFPWDSGVTIPSGGTDLKGGYTVVALGDAGGLNPTTKYQIRYEGGNISAGSSSGAIDYTYTTHSVIKINTRPGIGTSSPQSKVFINNIYIDSDTGGTYYAHEYFDVFGTVRPALEQCYAQGCDLGHRSLGAGAFNPYIGFDIYECYGPTVYSSKAQNVYWGFLSGDNGGNGESGAVRFSTLDSVFKGGRRETRGTEPGFAFDYSHINHTAGGLEFASVKRINVRRAPIYNDADQIDNPWLSSTTDISLDSGSYDLTVEQCTFNNTRDMTRIGIACATSVAADRTIRIVNNDFGAVYNTAIDIDNSGNTVLVRGNTYSADVTSRVSIGGVLYDDDISTFYLSVSPSIATPKVPRTITGNKTIRDQEAIIINNKSGSSCTITLPSATSCAGRLITFINNQAQTVVSASSNVVPITGGAAGTAILAATAGKWCDMVSDGTSWVIIRAG